jgi:hypothetical protein
VNEAMRIPRIRFVITNETGAIRGCVGWVHCGGRDVADQGSFVRQVPRYPHLFLMPSPQCVEKGPRRGGFCGMRAGLMSG